MQTHLRRHYGAPLAEQRDGHDSAVLGKQLNIKTSSFSAYISASVPSTSTQLNSVPTLCTFRRYFILPRILSHCSNFTLSQILYFHLVLVLESMTSQSARPVNNHKTGRRHCPAIVYIYWITSVREAFYVLYTNTYVCASHSIFQHSQFSISEVSPDIIHHSGSI